MERFFLLLTKHARIDRIVSGNEQDMHDRLRRQDRHDKALKIQNKFLKERKRCFILSILPPQAIMHILLFFWV
jgi:hypothetical protein